MVTFSVSVRHMTSPRKGIYQLCFYQVCFYMRTLWPESPGCGTITVITRTLVENVNTSCII